MTLASPDIDAYVADVLELVRDGVEVSMRHVGDSMLELRAGADVETISAAHARGTLRWICARLCILFSADGELPPLYGGQLDGVAQLGGARCEAHLSFHNSSAAPIQFTLSPAGVTAT